MSTGIIVRIDWNEKKWEKPSENPSFTQNLKLLN